MAYIAWDRFGWDGERHGLATVDVFLTFFSFRFYSPFREGAVISETHVYCLIIKKNTPITILEVPVVGDVVLNLPTQVNRLYCVLQKYKNVNVLLSNHHFL
jgi:hypothetical protein